MTMTHFAIGQLVDVLNPYRLPVIEECIGTARVKRVTQSSAGEPIYWLDSPKFICGRSVRVLRPHIDQDTNR